VVSLGGDVARETQLRIGSTPRVALVGGGKTTTMFALAREAATPVIVASTAHTAVEQLALVDRYHAPLFIEADSAKYRPLKAPAEHEPPIPNFVDTVIAVVGLSGLGQPLDVDHVHRPVRYARLSS
jgi:hypothetical protein